MRSRLKACFVAPLAALLFLALAGTAAAGEKDHSAFEAGDPLTTNIPYVAWAGEEVRLVKCVEGDWRGVDAEWNIVSSSTTQPNGTPRDPVFFDDLDRRTSAFAGAGDQRDRTCWAIDIDSVHPGMTRVKMALDDGGPSGSPILKHDFLVIWLAMSAPTLTELGDDAFPGFSVGDPLGDGNFAPIDGDFLNGLVRVTVTGSFVDLFGNTFALPADWASLAGRYAADTELDNNPMRWDIHDDQLETEGHTATSMCGGLASIDAVDNCLGGGEIGRFSRTVGGTSFTLGPFDPVRPGSSFLPDGKLDAGDAPMPAARIDVSLNGTVGSLEAADKHVLYSRNRTGEADAAHPDNAHNLYAPFYAALIPADISALASGIITTSGTHGTIANNFPGYQVGPLPGIVGAYHYWDLLNTRTRGGVNTCRDVGGTGQFGDGTFIPLPAGFDRATVYTDEHGEAILQFNPDVGAALVANNQGLCDLGEVNGAALLGSATISAVARDPFQLTFNLPRVSNVLTKNVFELAGKSLDCIPKSPIEAFCVEVIRDIRGNPVAGAPVSFSREPRGLIAPGSLAIAPYDTTNQVVVSETDNEIVIRTNSLGQAGIVVKSTLPGLVDIDAENIATRNGGFGVQRVRCIRFAGDGVTLPTDGPTCANPTDGGGTIPTPPVPPVTNGQQPAGPTSNGVASAAAAAVVVSLAGTSPVAVKAPAGKAKAKATARLASAKFVVIKGKRYLVLRAKGTAKTLKVRIVLVMRTGKVMKPVVRTIRTNRAVRVSKLQISKHVKSVRVSAVR
jgi:hypothetical protein